MIIIVPYEKIPELKRKYFRTPRHAKAGNFLPGLSYLDIKAIFWRDMLPDIELAQERNQSKIRVTYTARKIIGWATFEQTQEFDPKETEKFQLTSRIKALQYIPSQLRLAPLTNEVTFALRVLPNGQKCFIEEMYPGPDAGAISRNMSALRHIVYFHPNQDGELYF